MKAPPVIVRPWVEFNSSLPTDTIGDEHSVLRVGGKTIAEEIGKILVRLGCAVEEPEYANEHGWVFNAVVEGRNLYCQSTDVGHFLLLIEDKPYLGWFRKRPNLVYWDILAKLADELGRDGRFWDILWGTSDSVMSRDPGAARPIGDQPPILSPFWKDWT